MTDQAQPLVPLQTGWDVYLNLNATVSLQYNDTNVFLYTIRTIQDFWSVFKNVVSPTHLPKKYAGFSMFRHGVRPTWEDAQNAEGCDIFCRFPPEEDLDGGWEGLLMLVVGETLPHAEHITGVRIVWKNRFPRFEVWLGACEADVPVQISQALGDEPEKFVFQGPREHGKQEHTIIPDAQPKKLGAPNKLGSARPPKMLAL